ncbi:ATP-binding cassette domain-containing protein [Roseovarius spongiae]|uniref:ATP-binding cassette domain-containing protein n=1 Tax=Roseovarius spongiae TaxID=2320272 RepID=A0A3A8B6S6_9RHOB|nr:ATP-binding cassette domain-containing protein [Roseovarius spongiae]RKF16985.1 ATP-binding cassette domain-containing protein [Roseovarius spongiae]
MVEMLPLVATGVTVTRRGKRLIGPVDLNIEGDGVTVVIGPNGAGKTTLLQALHGITRLNAGTVRWACPATQARRAQAFVFQTPVMLRRSVLENLIYPLRAGGMARKAALALGREWCGRIGLGAAEGRPATVLSRGEKQKLAIARALIIEPAVLFLDEPSASLDGGATREVETLIETAAKGGTRVILSTHDMGQARRLARDAVFLLRGRVHERGPAPEFFHSPGTAQARAFLAGDIVE